MGRRSQHAGTRIGNRPAVRGRRPLKESCLPKLSHRPSPSFTHPSDKLIDRLRAVVGVPHAGAVRDGAAPVDAVRVLSDTDAA